MENRIKGKVDTYLVKMKEDIKKFAIESSGEKERYNDILKFVYEYEPLCLTAEDFTKRKRVKNTVPIYERCCAKRANGEQCTRRRKDSEMYCGTHIKGTPHGVFNKEKASKPEKKTVEVWVEDIKGIVYYIDGSGNVYNTEDIVANRENARIIARWEKSDKGEYRIPEFEKD